MGARERWSRDDGFTLIELAIVVIIIGILATIAIAVFLTQREKAERSSAVSSVRNTLTLAEAIRFDENEFPDDPSAFTDEGGSAFTFVNTESTDPTVVSIATYDDDGSGPTDGGPMIVIAAQGGDRCYWLRRETGEDPVRGFEVLGGTGTCTAADGSYVSVQGGGW